jgi:hypothetical protein
LSWFTPCEELSAQASEILTSLATSGQSESAAVADCLNTIAENGGIQATDAYLVCCAEMIIEAAQDVITALREAL